jgi:hypothetical protein
LLRLATPTFSKPSILKCPKLPLRKLLLRQNLPPFDKLREFGNPNHIGRFSGFPEAAFCAILVI